jgi:hypothetical protein
MGEPSPFAAFAARARRRWRAWLRACHRDIGYLLVGLTFVYAISGVAINHIDEWNPNFEDQKQTVELGKPLPDDTDEAVALVLGELGIDSEPESVEDYGAELEIYIGSSRAIRADRETGIIYDDHQEPRFFLRVANWLHYNRGKAAWTYIADGYAFLLLFLATSGIFMLKGRKGFIGRGVILVALGVAIPILYVHWSGGP